MAINKVVYDGNTLIDITDSTVDASDVVEGKYFYPRSGIRTLGTLSDGDELGYGDPTEPMVGVAQVDYAIIKN